MFAYETLSTLWLVAFIILGLGLLTWGGDSLAKGASGIAVKLKINPLIIGLTVVSMATSAPEFLAVLIAALRGSADLAIGNIVGSNLGNIGLILSCSALVCPVLIQRRVVTREMPVLIAATALFWAFSLGGGITRIEGAALFVCMLAYLYYLVRTARTGEVPANPENAQAVEAAATAKNNIPSAQAALIEEVAEAAGLSWFACWGFCLLGSAALALGAEVLIGSSVQVGLQLNISEVVIGITVVALGTSLPELAASVAAALRKESGLVAGNVVGSNLFNLLFVGGGVASGFGLNVRPSLLRFEYPAVAALTLLLWLVFATGKKVQRWEGVLLLLVYAGILAWALMA